MTKNQLHWLERTELLIKKEGIEKLQNASVLVVGLGGVGAFACEFLVRAGVGNLTIVDGDSVDITNKNRQLVALNSTIEKPKTEIMAQRLYDINPNLNLTIINEFLSPERAFEIVNNQFNYVADCIDSLSPKISLIKACKVKKIKLISSMGAGGLLNPSKVCVTNIEQTRDCPLARSIRKRLKKENCQYKFKVVFSNELPSKDTMAKTDGSNFKLSYYGTISYIPALFGIYVSATIINYLLKK